MRRLVMLTLGLFAGSLHAAGSLETATLDRYTGWACQNDIPDAITGIHIWRDDAIFLGGGNAPNPRESAVAEACRSIHPNHGFDIAISLPPGQVDNKWHDVRVYLIKQDNSSEELIGSPKRVYFGYGSPPAPPPTQPYYVGRTYFPPQGDPPHSLPVTTGWPCGNTCTKSYQLIDQSAVDNKGEEE